MADKVAFRCRACGFMWCCTDASESATPHQCRNCHKGVVFGVDLDACLAHADCVPHKEALAAVPRASMLAHHSRGGRVIPLPFGVKFLLRENWEILADAKAERLAELGLTPEQVERHQPWVAGHHGREPAVHSRETSEGVGTSEQAG